jgi:uncharacterized lipoprotein
MKTRPSYLLPSLLVVALTACAPAVINYTFQIPAANPDLKETLTAAVQVLTERGFTIQSVSDLTGLLTTEWKDVSNKNSQAFEGALVGAKTVEVLKLSVRVDQKSGAIAVTPTYQTHAQNIYGGGPSAGNSLTLPKKHKATVNAIAGELATALKLDPAQIRVVEKPDV